MSIRVLCSLMLTALAHGQTLRISTAPARPGETAAAAILLEAAPGKTPMALQWELDIPAEATGQAEAPAAGEAARSAGKQLQCTGHWKKAPQVYSFLCILAGGQRLIGEGPLALLKFTIPASARPGSYRFRVDNAVAVMQDMNKVALKPAEGTLTVKK